VRESFGASAAQDDADPRRALLSERGAGARENGGESNSDASIDSANVHLPRRAGATIRHPASPAVYMAVERLDWDHQPWGKLA
jgi:hypothetical protein